MPEHIDGVGELIEKLLDLEIVSFLKNRKQKKINFQPVFTRSHVIFYLTMMNEILNTLIHTGNKICFDGKHISCVFRFDRIFHSILYTQKLCIYVKVDEGQLSLPELNF